MKHSDHATAAGPRLDHNAVWVSNTERSAHFLVDVLGWKRHPIRIAVSEDDKTIGGIIGTFIDGNGLWIELIEPTSPGPGMDILNRVGDGAIVEINFELGDEYESVLASLTDRGIQMLSMDGTPIREGGRIAEGVIKGQTIESLEQTGQRIAYFPENVSRGPGIEYYERRKSDVESLINVRDLMWRNVEREVDAPRVHHVTILVKDIEETAAFYTDIVGLKRHAATLKSLNCDLYGGGVEIAYINANGVFPSDLFIKLVKPITQGPLKQLSEIRGDGHLMEIGVEIQDLTAFKKRMDDRQIELTNFEGQALFSGSGNFARGPEGHKACYFSMSDSYGMRIMLFERSINGLRNVAK